MKLFQKRPKVVKHYFEPRHEDEIRKAVKIMSEKKAEALAMARAKEQKALDALWALVYMRLPEIRGKNGLLKFEDGVRPYIEETIETR